MNDQAESLRVHGVAIPTMDGIRNVLTYLGAQVDGKQQANVLWINLREEPVISLYLFVLIKKCRYLIIDRLALDSVF